MIDWIFSLFEPRPDYNAILRQKEIDTLERRIKDLEAKEKASKMIDSMCSLNVNVYLYEDTIGRRLEIKQGSLEIMLYDQDAVRLRNFLNRNFIPLDQLLVKDIPSKQMDPGYKNKASKDTQND